CTIRGPIGLIRKGSGQVVATAELADCLPPLLTAETYAAAEPRHGIPPAQQAAAMAGGWLTPWVLENIHPLPVGYRHPSGAVTWVNLEPEVAEAVRMRLGRPSALALAASAPRGCVVEVRDVVVTGGNLRNQHLYVPLDFFPDDAVGGTSKDEPAPRLVRVTFRPGVTVETDIPNGRRFLRERAAFGDFYARAGVQEGDVVRITRRRPYEYEIAKAEDA
ncbi:MAG TPA: hypothetical protein VMU37_00250, partial [Caulobacteraceae bacterium]|nr:hypothetical protein [Caulobacteraceae bacterium]